MIFVVLLLLMIIVSKSEIYEFNEGYLSKDQTSVINGIFVIIVFLGHSFKYTSLGSVFDTAYDTFRFHMDQMIVVPFLFYSGFGMMAKTKSGGYQYVKSIATKRLPRVWINFAAAILFYLIIDILIGDIPSFKKILLAFTGWTGIGNSSWYMFVIFSLYLIMFLAFWVLRFENGTNRKMLIYIGAIIFTILAVCFVLLLVIAGQRPHFYDTIPAFIMGVWYALFHEKIELFFCDNKILFSIVATIICAIYLSTYHVRASFIFYPLWEFGFVSGLLLLTMKVKVSSRLFEWFGHHVFSIYILQRIPMNILSYYGIDKSEPYSFIVFSLVSTIAVALTFEELMKWVEKLGLKIKARK